LASQHHPHQLRRNVQDGLLTSLSGNGGTVDEMTFITGGDKLRYAN